MSVDRTEVPMTELKAKLAYQKAEAAYRKERTKETYEAEKKAVGRSQGGGARC